MLHRGISLLLIFISISFIIRMYIYAPWQFSPNEFLFEPILFFAIPILLVGGVLWFRPKAFWPPVPVPFIVLIIGIGGILFQGEWPTPNLPTTWEDSYQTLGILEGLFLVASGPLYLCCLLSILTGFSKKSSRIGE